MLYALPAVGNENAGLLPQVAFGKRVLQARLDLERAEKREITQADLQQRLGWGKGNQRISLIEKGQRERITIADAADLARELNADLHYLITGEQRQKVSKLAADIDRLKFDKWGESAVRQVARSEAHRFQEQQKSETFTDEDVIQRIKSDAALRARLVAELREAEGESHPGQSGSAL